MAGTRRVRLRTVLLVCAAAGCLIYGALVLARASRERESLQSGAKRAIDAFWKGDADTLASLQAKEELDSLKVSKKSMKALLEWTKSALAGFKPSGPTTEEVGQDGYLLLVTQPITGPDGQRTTLQIQFYQTPDGPKAFLSKPLVAAALVGKYGLPYDSLREKTRIWAAIRDGIEKESPALRAIGLNGLADTAYPGRVSSWQDFTGLANRVIQSSSRRGEPVGNGPPGS